MESFGFDNISISRRLTSRDKRILYEHLPQLWARPGVNVIRHGILWVELRRDSSIIINLNIPKSVRTDNVILGSHRDVESALHLVARETGLDCSDADVRSVDFTLTWSSDLTTNDLEAMLQQRRGYAIQRVSNTVYQNSTSGLLTVAAYEKVKHLQQASRFQTAELHSLGKSLPRIELRLKKVRKQLKRLGLWQAHSLRAKDLTTPVAFQAFARFFEMRAGYFFKESLEVIPKRERESKLVKIYRASPKEMRAILKKMGEVDTLEHLERMALALKSEETLAEIRNRISSLSIPKKEQAS
jgi:hypothetical protein